MVADATGLAEALRRQAAACSSLGSTQYARLIEQLSADVERRGLVHELLAGRPEDPLRDALVLRLLGAVHGIVLRGDAPLLAARYPSAGGDGADIALADFLDVVGHHRTEVIDALGRTVQTNEVGRCAALLPSFASIARATALPLHMLEVGASAGLISNWDRYRYDCFGSTYGDTASEVQLENVWREAFDLRCPSKVLSRGACDVSPLDVLDPDNRLRLLSFVWPDQAVRFERLARALDVAARHRPDIDTADAADWLIERLAERPDGATTIVFHSIVWQYLPRDTKERMRSALAAHGSRATRANPLAWVRMEPAGPVADVRVTLWPNGDDRIDALTSYHGADIRRPNSHEAG